ncbi:hypothetical protein CP061683_0747B, partial [Chlamydia psittaci 06-1683]
FQRRELNLRYLLQFR